MKKFDHLTSLDAIDPFPCKLGAKVESGKLEETSFHMGHKLKPGFSIKDGKLSYIPPTPTIKPKRFEFIEIPANVQRGMRGGVTIGEIKELNRDFDGDATTIPELNAVFDPQIQSSLNSPTPVVSRKLNNSGVSGAFLRKTPLFDPTAHTTLNAKAHIERLDRMAKEGCRWDSIAKQFINFDIDFTPKEPEHKEVVTLDSLTEIADSMVTVQRQEPDPVTFTFRVQKKKLNDGRVGIAIDFPKTNREEAPAESEVVTPKQDAAPEQSEIDAVVRYLPYIDQSLLDRRMTMEEAVGELLPYRKALLAKCLQQEDVINLSGHCAQALSRRFHTDETGCFDEAAHLKSVSELYGAITDILKSGPSKIVQLLQTVAGDTTANPGLAAMVPFALHMLSNFELLVVIAGDQSSDIPEVYRAVLLQERNRRTNTVLDEPPPNTED